MTQWNKNVQEKAWADSKETTTAQVAVVGGILFIISIDDATCASSHIFNSTQIKLTEDCIDER